MKKYQVVWGWNPPQYDMVKGAFRLFYASDERTKEVVHEDPETGESTCETVHEWLCDIVEYTQDEAGDIIRLIREGKDSAECQKQILTECIKAYDKSRHVEDFTIGGIHLWLDHDMRGKVKENLETCQQLGEENTTLRFNGMAFPVTVAMGWQMYWSVLAYARECWNVTESHLVAASKLQTVEEILAYDYKAGYPSKLAF